MKKMSRISPKNNHSEAAESLMHTGEGWNIPRYALDVLNRLEEHGHQAWFAGGCVRDLLMGKEPKDYDIASSAAPNQVQAIFEKTVPTGEKHGTITVLSEGKPVEVTTFRKESGYSDHRHPDAVSFVSDVQEDLSRRDFTINAMAWNPKRGLLDLFGGQADLQKKIIRAVGDPNRRFQEDALRMFRAFRFAARFGFSIEENTLQAIHENEAGAAGLAVERVVREMEEIMREDPDRILQMTGLLDPWIPELSQMKDCAQNTKFHYTDVLRHTLDALKYLHPFDAECAWALLLHDTGKPAVKQHYGGEDHFKKHEAVSAQIAQRVVRTLKLPAKMIREIPVLVAMHDTFYAPRPANLYKVRLEKGLDDALLERLFAVQYGDIMAHAMHDRLKPWHAFKTFYETARDAGMPFSVRELPVNGTEIHAQTGLEGVQIGQAQQRLLKELICHPDAENLKKDSARVEMLLDKIAEQIRKESEEADACRC